MPMESREAKVVFVPLPTLVEMLVERAKDEPGILPDPMPRIEMVHFEVVGGKALKAVFTFAPKGGLTVVVKGGGPPDA